MSLADLTNARRSSGNPLLSNTITLSGNLTRDMDVNNIPNNNEGIAFLGMAYACASLEHSSIAMPSCGTDGLVVTAVFPRDYTGETAQTGEPNIADGTNRLDHVRYFNVGDLIRGPTHANGVYPSYILGRRTPEDLADYNVSNVSNCLDPEAKKLLLTVAEGADDWMQWFVDLVNAFQTGGLTAANVRSYFAWNNFHDVEGNYIAAHMCELSGGVDRIANHAETRELLRKGKWTEYRLNFATVVGQLVKMIDELPREHTRMFSDRTITNIRAAAEQHWSEEAFRNIGTRPLAVLQAWLMVSGNEINNLWSAQKAYSELTVAEKESLKNWFTIAHKKLKTFKGGLTENFNHMPDSLKDI